MLAADWLGSTACKEIDTDVQISGNQRIPAFKTSMLLAPIPPFFQRVQEHTTRGEGGHICFATVSIGPRRQGDNEPKLAPLIIHGTDPGIIKCIILDGMVTRTLGVSQMFWFGISEEIHIHSSIDRVLRAWVMKFCSSSEGPLVVRDAHLAHGNT